MSHFYAHTKRYIRKDIRLLLPLIGRSCTSESVGSLARTGGDSLFYINFYSIKMPKNHGIEVEVNNSSLNCALVHETGTITFSSLMEEAISQFNVEKDAKNKAYAFILSRGLLSDFKAYCEAHRGEDHHSAAISYLYSQI